MRSARAYLLSASLAAVVLLLSVGCSGSPQAANQPSNPYTKAVAGKTPTNGTLKENDEAAVTLSAQWMGQREGLLVFGVSMNTHSVDLDAYDLGKISLLLDDGGTEYLPVAWVSQPGGHHRSGTLSFAIPQSMISGQTTRLKLVVKGIAGVERRVLEWDF